MANKKTRQAKRRNRKTRLNRKKYGGARDDPWKQYGDVMIRQKRGMFGSGQYYIVKVPVPSGRQLNEQTLLDECASGTVDYCGMINVGSGFTNPEEMIQHIDQQVNLENADAYATGQYGNIIYVSNFLPAIKSGTFTKFTVDIHTALVEDDRRKASDNLRSSKYKNFTSI